MRAMALVVGVGMGLAGLAVAQDQLLLWQQDGFCTPIPLSALWIALWGASPDPMWLRHVSGIEAWLLDQPVTVVLPLVGGFLAWIGVDGIGGRTSLRR